MLNRTELNRIENTEYITHNNSNSCFVKPVCFGYIHVCGDLCLCTCVCTQWTHTAPLCKMWVVIHSENHCLRQHVVWHHYTGEGTEIQRSYNTCPESHRLLLTVWKLEPHVLIPTSYHKAYVIFMGRAGVVETGEGQGGRMRMEELSLWAALDFLPTV